MDNVRTYAVTGHVGGYAAHELLRAGHRVRVMGRDPERLKELEAAGADVFVGDLADRGYVEDAFADADGALLIVPPHPAAPDFPRYQRRIAGVCASAAAQAGLRHAAFISTQGADDHVGGLIAGHATIARSATRSWTTPPLQEAVGEGTPKEILLRLQKIDRAEADMAAALRP